MASRIQPHPEIAPARNESTLLTVIAVTAAVVLLVPMFGALKEGTLATEANMLYAALVFYGAAAALYLSFGVTGGEKYSQFASASAVVGLAATSLAAGHRWYIAGHPPFSSIYEMLLSFVWTLAALTLFIERKYHVRMIGSVTMPLAVVSVALMQLLPSSVRPLVPALQSTWLHIHVTLAMLSYAACAVSFALAIMFLMRDRVRTETFLLASGAGIVAIYLGIATRFDAAGSLQVIAWDAAEHRAIYFAERIPLMVGIPGLGWLLTIVLVSAVIPLAMYAWGLWNKEERIFAWANRLFLVSTILQALGLAAFVSRSRSGAYPTTQTEGYFATHLAASPFLMVGLISGLFISVLCLMLMWRRGSLESMLPAAEKLDRLTYTTIGIAFPLLTLMIAAGAFWANRTWGSYWSWDPKETWALITWFVYAGYLHMRITRGWRGRRAAYFAILGFIVVLFTFFGVTYLLPGLHAYS